MLGSVFLKTLRDRRRGLAAWSLGLVAAVLMYGAFYPSVRDNAEALNEYVENLPAAIRGMVGESGDFTSPAGYIQSELFSTMAPLLFLIFAIGAGARATAGEEEHRTLDILLSTALPRRRIVIEKLAAMVAALAWLALLLWASIAALGPPFDLRVGLWNLAAACLGIFLLAVAFGSAALAIGSARGSRVLALGVSAAVAFASYILNVLAPAVDALGTIRKVSPFYLYIGTEPLRRGLNVGHAATLAAVAVVLAAVAVVTFERRDLAA